MRNIFYIIVIFLLTMNSVFAQREATHTITNFDVNTTTNKFSFDIYSQSTGPQSSRVGLTSYFFNFSSSILSSPVLTNINSKYTVGSPTGDYDAMTVEIVLGEIAVTILFTGNGNGTGDTLSTINPVGELMCTVTLDITNPNATISLTWDQINSTMNTPTFQTVTNIYQGSYEPPVSVEFEILPTKYELYQNYPNPFNPITIIKFSLPEQTQVKLNLYNMLGELVRTLAEGTYEAGYHKVTFNASTLPSGVYIYRIECDAFVQVKKMILLR